MFRLYEFLYRLHSFTTSTSQESFRVGRAVMSSNVQTAFINGVYPLYKFHLYPLVVGKESFFGIAS